MGLVGLALWLFYPKLFYPAQPQTVRSSNYAIFRGQPQPELVAQATYDPQLFQPVAPWLGRLILKDKGVELEVPMGDRYQLQWQDDPQINRYRQLTKRDVQFTAQAIASQASGNINPERLQRQAVDPLESLAGARPLDDVWVKLVPQRVEGSTITIATEPIQIAGTHYALVQIVKSEADGQSIVRHFNRATGKFDGPFSRMIIPQVVPDRDGVLRFTTKGLEASQSNQIGWYVYGRKTITGEFLVQAIAPRQLFQLNPQVTFPTAEAGIRYITKQTWEQSRQDTTQVAWLANLPQSQQRLGDRAIIQPESDWRLGDRVIVMHIFGGIGGAQAEPTTFGIVTGHFSYGLAEVIWEPLAAELQWQITYYQIYAHNPDGIISGKISWAEYMGNLERGWLGNRPIADILIHLPAVTQDYDFGGTALSPWDEFQTQLMVMMARYRVGDGTGAALVTPATSCVQDSNQALYVTIRKITDQVAGSAQIEQWLAQNPNHPQTKRFNQLAVLGQALEKELEPLGIVRGDWQRSVQEVIGTGQKASFFGETMAALTTWRTLLPRAAFDRLARIFLEQGAQLWVIRTNQVGGTNPQIAPLPPTAPHFF